MKLINSKDCNDKWNEGKMTDKKERCEDCKFWETNDNPSHFLGSCKAPAPVAGKSGPARWPMTHKDEWCGEFKKIK